MPMHTMLQDLRHALRQMRKSPLFTLTAVLTLALGIGSTTAIFTVVDQVVLRMLPVRSPKQLMRLEWHGAFSGSARGFGGTLNNYFSYPMYKDLQARNQVFSGMLAAVKTHLGVSRNGESEEESAELVSGNYFQVLGLRPAIGRLFSASDETAKDANAVAVLSYDYWRTHFAGSREVIGQSILINGHPFEIVGVAPAGFLSAIGGYRPVVFLPVTMIDVAVPSVAPRHNLDNHQSIWLTLVGRLKPGVTAGQAQARLGPLWHALRAQEFLLYKDSSARFHQEFVDHARLLVKDDASGFSPDRMDLATPLFLLMGMAGLLTTMCVLNVATLLLLRAAARSREISMRYALGAKFRQVTTQLLTEGALLGLTGAIAGIAISPFLAATLVRLLTDATPGNDPYSSAVDARVLAFSVLLTLVVTLLFSAAPVLHFLRPNLAVSLRQNTGTASRAAQRFRKVAVGTQIALSILLLGGAGLFLRTLQNLDHQPVGFDTRHLATFELNPAFSGYSEAGIAPVLWSTLDAIRRIPGVKSVAGTTDRELATDSHTDEFLVQGHRPVAGENMDFETAWITPFYFATLQQPLLTGREFSQADGKGAAKTAIVNLAFARRFYGSAQNALGREIGDIDKGNAADITIVGVVGNVKHYDLRSEFSPAIYLPYLQLEHPLGMQVYVRSAQEPEAVEAPIRKAVQSVNPLLVVDDLRSMQSQVESTAATERALAVLSIAIALLSISLAAVGLYGVLAYSTQNRIREIGVRLALGSPRKLVVALIVSEMAWISMGAAIIAIPSTIALAQLFRSQLYGVAVFDPRSLATALLLTLCLLLLAAALPARRAASVDPNQALREE